MTDEDIRAALDALIRDRNEDFASLSRLIGRNPAYVQQYIKRGTPRRLAEADRRMLALYFRIDEALLGGPSAHRPRVANAEDAPARRDADLVLVPRLDVGASAGAGAAVAGEGVAARIGFDPNWLRGLSGDGPAGLSIIQVQGDSMAPTLGDGDEILVDRGDASARLRDGIYVLRKDDGLMVKRIALHPAGDRLSVISDNDAYPSWPDCDRAEIEPIGRVVWMSRRLA